VPQNVLIEIIPLFADFRKNSTPSPNNTCLTKLTDVGGPFRGSAH